MTDAESLDTLLVKLCAGDAAAAEQVFRTYEPYLRMVVRRLLPPRLRTKFDSMDVVQSVWADLLYGFRDSGWHFENAAQLKAFLVKVTRNRFIDRVRRYRGANEHEQVVSAEATGEFVAWDPRPSQVAEAEEAWRELLALCPPAHRDLLRLKREGRSLAEIAAETGLHISSVRRILYELARRFALERPRRECS